MVYINSCLFKSSTKLRSISQTTLLFGPNPLNSRISSWSSSHPNSNIPAPIGRPAVAALVSFIIWSLPKPQSPVMLTSSSLSSVHRTNPPVLSRSSVCFASIETNATSMIAFSNSALSVLISSFYSSFITICGFGLLPYKLNDSGVCHFYFCHLNSLDNVIWAQLGS